MFCTITGTVASQSNSILTVSATPRPTQSPILSDSAIVNLESVAAATLRDGTFSLRLVQGAMYRFRIGPMSFEGQVPYASTMDIAKIISPVPYRVGICSVKEEYIEEEFVKYAGSIIETAYECCSDSCKFAIRSEYSNGVIYLPVDLQDNFTVVADNTAVILSKCYFEVTRPSDGSDTTLLVEDLAELPQPLEYWFGKPGSIYKCDNVLTIPTITILWR